MVPRRGGARKGATSCVRRIPCRIKVRVENKDGSVKWLVSRGLCVAHAKPVDVDNMAGEASLPAASEHAVEIADLLNKVIVDTGTKSNLVGRDVADKAPDAVYPAEAEGFITANGRIEADSVLEGKVALMGDRRYRFHILEKPRCIVRGLQGDGGRRYFYLGPEEEALIYFSRRHRRYF